MKFVPKEFGLEIIESLTEDDEKTGQKLYDAVVKYKTFEEPNLQASLYCIKTKEEFLEILKKIHQRVISDCFFPILHIEMHGFKNGLQLSSGENVLWDEIMPILRKINVYVQNSLVIMLAACEGANILFRPNTSDRAPFRAIISTLKKVSQDDILKAFEAFYNTYFFSLDPWLAVDEMNIAIQKPHTFGVLKSEDFFDDVLNPNRDRVFFNNLIEQQAVYEKLTIPEYANTPLHILKLWIGDRTLKIFEKERKNRDYFTMKDLRGK
ncbi:MAG TPA: hypothetical protein VKG26_05220 [Bacteroidia bacterium]|nr:hypothetical protein [Bacteroidia bacterium]